MSDFILGRIGNRIVAAVLAASEKQRNK